MTDWQLNELLSAAATEDAALRNAVTEIFCSYRTSLYRYLLGILRDPAEAEDVTQEVFLRLYTELRNGRRISSGRAWIFRTGHNLAVDRRRRNVKQELLDDEGWARLGARQDQPGPDVLEEISGGQRRDAVFDALAQLTVQERRAMELRSEGLRYREIAGILGVRIPSVQTYLARAIRKLLGAIDA